MCSLSAWFTAESELSTRLKDSRESKHQFSSFGLETEFGGDRPRPPLPASRMPVDASRRGVGHGESASVKHIAVGLQAAETSPTAAEESEPILCRFRTHSWEFAQLLIMHAQVPRYATQRAI